MIRRWGIPCESCEHVDKVRLATLSFLLTDLKFQGSKIKSDLWRMPSFLAVVSEILNLILSYQPIKISRRPSSKQCYLCLWINFDHTSYPCGIVPGLTSWSASSTSSSGTSLGLEQQIKLRCQLPFLYLSLFLVKDPCFSFTTLSPTPQSPERGKAHQVT